VIQELLLAPCGKGGARTRNDVVDLPFGYPLLAGHHPIHVLATDMRSSAALRLGSPGRATCGALCCRRRSDHVDRVLGRMTSLRSAGCRRRRRPARRHELRPPIPVCSVDSRSIVTSANSGIVHLPDADRHGAVPLTAVANDDLRLQAAAVGIGEAVVVQGLGLLALWFITRELSARIVIAGHDLPDWSWRRVLAHHALDPRSPCCRCGEADSL
jgi:hypothetical protein